MAKALSVSNLLSKKTTTYLFEGIYKQVLGNPSVGGFWLIYGKEKNGKTWGTLMLANYLSQFDKVLYVSAEEGFDKSFVDAVTRAGISSKNKNLQFLKYIPLEVLREKLAKRRAPKIVVLDNLTIYNNELSFKKLKKLKDDYPSTLFIMIAHEDKGKPYLSSAGTVSKLAKIIIRVVGLSMFVHGRCPGGELRIDQEKSILYHGVCKTQTIKTII